MLAMQNVDIESSFASSRLPEDKRSIDKQIKAYLLDSIDKDAAGATSRMTNHGQSIDGLNLLKSQTIDLPLLLTQDENDESENVNSSVQITTENVQDSVVILDVHDIHK